MQKQVHIFLLVALFSIFDEQGDKQNDNDQSIITKKGSSSFDLVNSQDQNLNSLKIIIVIKSPFFVSLKHEVFFLQRQKKESISVPFF
jgi:hypothetical protein